MDPLLRADLTGLDDVLAAACAAAGGYLADLPRAPVDPTLPPPPPTRLPEHGVGAAEAVAILRRDWLPAMAAFAGPRFWGYVTGGTTPAALAGDWLAAAIDQNPASDEGAAATLERRTTGWLADLLALGPDQHGVMVTGATMANVAGLALAREWAGRRLGVDVSSVGLAGLAAATRTRTTGSPIRVLAGCAHSSVGKALSMLGLGRAALEAAPTLPGREAVDPAALESALTADTARRPVIVVASAGTVNTGDVDDLRALLDLRERHGFWLHVDGAFGAFAALAPTHAPLLAGIEAADSVTVDLHKWMNVPYDSAVSFTRHPELRPAVFGNAGAYLAGADDVTPLVHLGPENSRRLRALPAYAALLAYGRAGHADIVARTLAHAARFARAIEAMPGAHLLAPARLTIVCVAIDRPIPPVLAALAPTALLTPTTYGGQPAVRAAFSNWRTTDADVELAAEALARILA